MCSRYMYNTCSTHVIHLKHNIYYRCGTIDHVKMHTNKIKHSKAVKINPKIRRPQL